MDKFYDPEEIAELLGMGKDKVYSFLNSGELEGSDVSLSRGKRRWRVSQDALRRFLSARSNRPATALCNGPRPKRPAGGIVQYV